MWTGESSEFRPFSSRDFIVLAVTWTILLDPKQIKFIRRRRKIDGDFFAVSTLIGTLSMPAGENVDNNKSTAGFPTPPASFRKRRKLEDGHGGGDFQSTAPG